MPCYDIPIDGGAVSTVTISPKYQVVIPREAREELGLRPGQKVEVFVFDGRLELVPVKSLREMRGFVRGADTRFDRDDDRI